MIIGPPNSMVFEASGLAEAKQQFASSLAARLVGTTTISIIPRGRRGAAKNALIARAQANRRRNPFYLNTAAKQRVRFLANGLTSVSAAVRDAAAKQIGATMIVSIGENVAAQTNPPGGGKFTPLSEAYARRKQRRFGFTLPILKAEGDLLGGLGVRVDRSAR